MHLKRNNIGKFWAIPKKGTKYLAYASHNQNESIPLSVVMRDILKFVKTRRELKDAINEKKILINQKLVRDTNFPITLFDILTIENKNYKAILSKNKKLIFDEISEKEADFKIFKLLNRKILGKNKVQLNLSSGKNIISNEKIAIGDSVILNLKDNKISKIIKMEKGKTAFVIKGKHAGKTGKINEVLERGGKQIAKISLGDERINVWMKNIIVIE